VGIDYTARFPYGIQHTIVFQLKLCLGKNSIICPNSAVNKRIVVIMASKMRDEVCTWIYCQEDFVCAAASRMLEFSRVSDWETFSNGLFSGSSFEPSGRLLPLWYQVERIASSIPG